MTSQDIIDISPELFALPQEEEQDLSSFLLAAWD